MRESEDVRFPGSDALQDALVATQILIFELDADGCIVAFHGGDRRLLAISPESFPGRMFQDVMPDTPVDVLEGALGEAMVSGVSKTWSYALNLRTGMRHFELDVSAGTHPERSSGRYFAFVRDVTQRAAAERDRAAAERLIAIQEERDRLLADMHDGLGTQLTIARLRAERGTMGQEQMVEALVAMLADLHLVVDTLRDPEDSLAHALVDFRLRCDRRISNTNARVHWKLSLADAPHLPPTTRLHIVRIMQEAITNALRHSRRGHVTVSARFHHGTGFGIAIRDDGVGLPAKLVHGRGLYNMQRRAREIGAELTIANRVPPPGVEVLLRLPVDDAQVSASGATD